MAEAAQVLPAFDLSVIFIDAAETYFVCFWM